MRNKTLADSIYAGAQKYGKRAANQYDGVKRDQDKEAYATGAREMYMDIIIEALMSDAPEEKKHGKDMVKELVAMANEVEA